MSLLQTPKKRTHLIQIIKDDELIGYILDMQWIQEGIVSINTAPSVIGSIEVLAGESPDALEPFTVFTTHGGLANLRITQTMFPRFVQFILRKRGDRATMFIDSWFVKLYKPSDDYNMDKLKGLVL